MSGVLFGQSYFLHFDPKLQDAMQPYPPLGSLYAASFIRQQEYGVAFFDAMLASSEDGWEQKILETRPDFAVLFEDNFNYLSKMCLQRMRSAAQKMIKMAKGHGCVVILCGADATDHYDLYMQAGVDYVLLGEGEETLAELLAVLTGRQKTPIPQIRGLVHRAQSGGKNSICATPRRMDIQNLDDLPYPAWDLVDIEAYRKIWLERHGYFSMNLVTTRGCPFHCNWCAKPIWGQRYNTRSPENVAAEIHWLSQTYNPDHLWIVDDIFGLKPGWLENFADQMEAGGGAVPFKCLSRADLLLRPHEIDALRRAGAQTVWIGAESGSQHILDKMEKGTRVEQIYAASRKLREAGIRSGFFLQFGYPGETIEDIRKTIRMVHDCSPDDIGISVSYPLPGTKFYEMVKTQMLDKKNCDDSADLAILFAGEYSTEFYRQLHTVIHKDFRMRKAWQAIQHLTSAGKRFSLGQFGLAWVRLAYNLVSLPPALVRLAIYQRKRSDQRLEFTPMPQDKASEPTAQGEE